MSAESIAGFRAKLNSSQQLQVSMVEAVKSGPEAVIALGHAEGFVFDASDMQTAFSGPDMTDFELSMVAGGVDFSVLLLGGSGGSSQYVSDTKPGHYSVLFSPGSYGAKPVRQLAFPKTQGMW